MNLVLSHFPLFTIIHLLRMLVKRDWPIPIQHISEQRNSACIVPHCKLTERPCSHSATVPQTTLKNVWIR